MENLDKEKIRQALNALKEKLADIDAQEKEINQSDYGQTKGGIDCFAAAQKSEAERIQALRNQFLENIEYPDTREEIIASLKFLMSMIEVEEKENSSFGHVTKFTQISSKMGGKFGGRAGVDKHDDGSKWHVEYIEMPVNIFKRIMYLLTKAQAEYADVDNTMRLALIDFAEENNLDDLIITNDVPWNHMRPTWLTKDKMCGYKTYSLYRKGDPHPKYRKHLLGKYAIIIICSLFGLFLAVIFILVGLGVLE